MGARDNLTTSVTVNYRCRGSSPRTRPTARSLGVTIARGRGYDYARFDDVWQGLVDRAPAHRRGHQSALQYLCAKWYGSHERMFTFAEQAAKSSPAHSILVLQAAYEKDHDDPEIWRHPAVRAALDTHLCWLETEGAENADRYADIGWAALALVLCDRGAEAIAVFKLLCTNSRSIAPQRSTAAERVIAGLTYFTAVGHEALNGRHDLLGSVALQHGGRLIDWLPPGRRRVVDVESPLAVDEQGPERVIGKAVEAQNPPLVIDNGSYREVRVPRPSPLGSCVQFRVRHPLSLLDPAIGRHAVPSPERWAA